MEYAIIGIVVVMIAAISIVIIQKSKKSKVDKLSDGIEKVEETTESNIIPKDDSLQEIVIQMEMLPVSAISAENKLVEVTDSKVLAHIINLVPGLAQAGNAAHNAVRAIQGNSEVLYRAIIPAGAKLTDSRAMGGAVRGIYHGADGIKGHANLLAVEAQKGTAVVANTVAAAMGVASMVVGQYYMNQINAELGEISDGISKISDFQDNEYRSRVFSLVAHIKKIADFQVEILENNELRLSKISQLDSLEEECTQLLGQANLTITNYTNKNDFDFEAYEKELFEIQNWYMYQKSLLDILYKISELRYTLHLGAVSRDYCVTLLPTYSSQVADAQSRLAEWHQSNTSRLKIDIYKIRRKRDGFDGVIHFIPGLFNDDMNFRSIEKSTVKMIETQSDGRINEHQCEMSDLYAEDVQLISKGGKIYYLPSDQSSERPIPQ